MHTLALSASRPASHSARGDPAREPPQPPQLASHPARRGRKRRGGPVAGCRASALPGQPSRPCATSGHARVGTTAALVCHTRPPSQRTASAQCATPGHYALACLARPSPHILSPLPPLHTPFPSSPQQAHPIAPAQPPKAAPHVSHPNTTAHVAPGHTWEEAPRVCSPWPALASVCHTRPRSRRHHRRVGVPHPATLTADRLCSVCHTWPPCVGVPCMPQHPSPLSLIFSPAHTEMQLHMFIYY